MSSETLLRRILIGLVTPPAGWPPPAGLPSAVTGYSLPRRVFAGLVGVSLHPLPTDDGSGAGVPRQADFWDAEPAKRRSKLKPSATGDGPGASLLGCLGLLLLPLWLVVMGLVRLWQQLKGWVMARRRGAVDEALQRERLHHTALLDAGRRRFELLCRAIDDPSLAEAVSTHNDVPQPKRRQFLYIQAMYESLLLEHATGALPWDQLIARLRIFGRNEVVAEYWERTREERRAWPADSLEARVGQALDLIMDELGEDPDEWWVAGSDLTEDASS